MAGPWDQYASPSPPAVPQTVTQKGPWDQYAAAPPAPSAPKTEPYSSAVLPFSKDDQGKVHFDTNAGLFGLAKRALTAGGNMASGEMPIMNPATGHVSEQAIKRSADIATLASPASIASRAGELAIPGAANRLRQVEVKPPTAAALHDTGAAQFDAARNMGVDYSPKAVQNVATGIRTNLEKDGILAEVAPTTFRILKKLENPPKDAVAVTIAGIHAARRTFGEIAKDFNKPTEQAAATRAIAALDKFLANADPASVVAGPAADAAKTFNDAKANYAAGKRSDLLQGVEEKAGRRAAAANSGRNIGNTIRSRVASVLESDKKTAGFSDKELADLETVSRGTVGRNSARKVGNLFGGGGGLGMLLTGGGGAAIGSQAGGLKGALLGLAPAAVGYGAKSLDNALTRRALGHADEAVRSRSPLFRDMQANAPMTARDPELRALLLRALLAPPQRDPNSA